MNNERSFENIIPVPNIKVGYFEKEEYLKIIDRQEKQIESSAYQIMALQSRIEMLEKNQRPQGELANEVWKLYEKHQSHLATHVLEFGDELKELLGKYQKGGAE